MKKTKLKLETETLISLQANALEGVAGGASISAITIMTRVSCLTCIQLCGAPTNGGQNGGK